MYQRQHHLTSRPFAAGPQPERYVATSAAERARIGLAACLGRASGAGLLIGPTGTGKTLLALRLAEELRGACSPIVVNASQLTNRRALLQAILHRLAQPYRGFDEGELRLSLTDLLTHSDRCAGGLLLVIDDAQLLPPRLWAELRWLLDLQRQGQPVVRLLLAGNGSLEEILAQPRLESLTQSIAARAYLEPLSAGETEAYLRKQIELAGGDSERVFAADAYRAVHAATDGIPRLINQVADHALLIGYADAAPLVDGARIEQAWSDLQQMPAIWSGNRNRPATSHDAGDAPHVIEFGSLDDASAPPAVEQREGEPPVNEPRLKLVDHEEYQPEGAGNEVELTFSSLSAGLWDAFAEEEIVIDRYAELDARRLPRAPLTPQAEVQELSAALRAIEELQHLVDPLRAEAEMPRPFVPLPTGEPEIVIVEDDAPQSRPAAPAAAKKVEYRQLFARLRGSK